MILDAYNKNISIRENNSANTGLIDFKYILSIYLSNNELTCLDNIKKIIEDETEPDFVDDSFINLSNYICQVILETKNVQIGKIKELYLENYLIFDDLNRLVLSGIITPMDADDINKKFCTTERIEELAQMSIKNEHTELKKYTQPNDEINLSKISKSTQKKIEQAKIITDILRNLSFKPKTQSILNRLQPIMSLLPSGILKGNCIFLSKDYPEAVILVAFNQIPHTCIYNMERENDILTIPTSIFYNYISNIDNNLGIKDYDVIKSKYVVKTKIGKSFSKEIRRSIEQVSNLLSNNALEEHNFKGENTIFIDSNSKLW